MRIVGIVSLGLASLGLLGYGVLYLGSERIMRRTYEVPLAAFSAPDDPALLGEGERLARTRGCIGCHGTELQGGVFFDEPLVGYVVAPDLTRMVQEYSDPQLERVIRKGVRNDGRSVWVMPSSMYARLSNEDLGAIVAFVRSVPRQDGPETEVKLGVLGRIGVLGGKFRPQAEEIDPAAVPRVPDRDDLLDFGRYLALTSCTECHGSDLRGSAEMGAPPLVIAAAYSAEHFERLMRDGIALGDRELGMMSDVSRARFSHFTPAEVQALHAYLQGLAQAEEGDAVAHRDR